MNKRRFNEKTFHYNSILKIKKSFPTYKISTTLTSRIKAYFYSVTLSSEPLKAEFKA